VLEEDAMDPRAHWEKVYGTRKPTEVSWYQREAALSLSLIRRVAPERTAPILDVGGGASTLVDGLLAEGYSNVTVLDVSGAALEQAAARLGPNAARVTWLEANILDAQMPASAYALWHDRAVFHFLTDAAERRRYVEQVLGAVRVGGHVVVATFASDGPTRCSGLEVARYDPEELHAQFGPEFQLLESAREEHRTPSGAGQAFTYCMCRLNRVRL
jgi:SAM-dependent methyltransferase